jgi:hypothetical protein
MTRWWRAMMCDGKRRFASRRAAKCSRRAGKARLHAYVCPVCHHWHMGHKDPRGAPDQVAARRDYHATLARLRRDDREIDL